MKLLDLSLARVRGKTFFSQLDRQLLENKSKMDLGGKVGGGGEMNWGKTRQPRFQKKRERNK